jgi:hypothetical protein
MNETDVRTPSPRKQIFAQIDRSLLRMKILLIVNLVLVLWWRRRLAEKPS